MAEGDVTAPVDPMAGKATGTESSLSSWAGPYVTEMLGKGAALADEGYNAYMGPLTAGTSELQDKAFAGLGSLTLPTDTFFSKNRPKHYIRTKACGTKNGPKQYVQTHQIRANEGQHITHIH